MGSTWLPVVAFYLLKVDRVISLLMARNYRRPAWGGESCEEGLLLLLHVIWEPCQLGII